MLLLLGGRAIFQAVEVGQRGKTRLHRHPFGPHHEHPGPEEHLHVSRWVLARRPFTVGLMHGLAGSGAITALALGTMSSLSNGLIYFSVFGMGALIGMSLLAGLGGWSLERLTRIRHAEWGLRWAAGLLSTSFGVVHGWPVAVRLAHLL